MKILQKIVRKDLPALCLETKRTLYPYYWVLFGRYTIISGYEPAKTQCKTETLVFLKTTRPKNKPNAKNHAKADKRHSNKPKNIKK